MGRWKERDRKMKFNNRLLNIENRLPENQYISIEGLLRTVHLRAKQDLTEEERILLKKLESRPIEPKLAETLERLRTQRQDLVR